jgi:hypothetical protein
MGSTLFTVAALAHPFQVTITAPSRHPTIASIPQVYTDSGYKEAFVIFTGIALIGLLTVVFLMRFSRQRATGGLRH